ncbi:MAG: sugar ABC transporter permease [Synergistaceae bacterium]|nr:sugar ABC transporter permease [Synergistaceae bacterium]
MGKKSHLNRSAYSFIIPFFIIYFMFNFFPVAYSLFLSFTEWDGLHEIKFVGLDNYIRLFTSDPYFLKSIGNTLILMLEYIPLSVVLGLLLANALSSVYVKGKRFFQVVNYFPYIVTPVAVGLIFLILFEVSSGAINRILITTGVLERGIDWLNRAVYARIVVGIMLVWKNFGYCMMLYIAGIAAISTEIYEAGRIDGANARQLFFHITLPQLKPITLFVTTISIINGFQLFDEVKILFGGLTVGMATIGGPDRSVLTAVWNLYDTAFGFTGGTQRLGYGSAVAYGMFLFIMLAAVINFNVNHKEALNDNE